MKATITLAIGLLLFSGCNKCGNCTTTIKTTVNYSTAGFPQTQTATFEACGKEFKDADGQLVTVKQTIGGKTYTTTENTTCVVFR